MLRPPVIEKKRFPNQNVDVLYYHSKYLYFGCIKKTLITNVDVKYGFLRLFRNFNRRYKYETRKIGCVLCVIILEAAIKLLIVW